MAKLGLKEALVAATVCLAPNTANGNEVPKTAAEVRDQISKDCEEEAQQVREFTLAVSRIIDTKQWPPEEPEAAKAACVDNAIQQYCAAVGREVTAEMLRPFGIIDSAMTHTARREGRTAYEECLENLK